jgi:hypothetical protein
VVVRRREASSRCDEQVAEQVLAVRVLAPAANDGAFASPRVLEFVSGLHLARTVEAMSTDFHPKLWDSLAARRRRSENGRVVATVVHLKAIFAKFGLRSRRELVAHMFFRRTPLDRTWLRAFGRWLVHRARSG